MAMEVVQVLTAITIYYPTCMLDPQFHLELVNDTLLYTRINRRIQFHLFGGEVIWPGEVSVDMKGTIGMKFKKKEPREWESPFVPVKFNITNADIPKLWGYKTIKRKESIPNVYVVTLRPERRMYFHINVGHYISMHNTYKTREGKVVDYYRQFSPLPTLPLKSLEDPNPPPGKWRSMEMNLNLVGRLKPVKTVGNVLLNRTKESLVNFTDPFGTLFLPVFYEVEYLYIVTKSTGISAVLGLVLFLLQMTDVVKIQILYFNRVETEIFLRDELTSLLIADKRLDIIHIISNPTRDWRGQRGDLSEEVLGKFIPKFNKNTTSTHYCAICGHREFFRRAERLLLDKLLYPDTQIHAFLGE